MSILAGRNILGLLLQPFWRPAMSNSNRRILALGCCLLAVGAALIYRVRESTSAQADKTEPVVLIKEDTSPFVVGPYLQFPTRDSIVVMWETPQPGTSVVEYGESLPLKEKVAESKNAAIHEVTIRGLKPNTKYLYRVSTLEADGKTLEGKVLQFMTAVDEDSAFSFGIIGDTQKNPKMTAQIAKLIWDRHPHFVIHVGDVVDNGPDKDEWVHELFGPCQELFSRVPVFPTIGNHEKNHANYYQYFSLPSPKYFYRYHYGNADFFVVDSNKSLKPDSEQYKWLDAELGKSTAVWKFVYHHHPVWSSDEDDYGDTTKNIARLGDLNARNLVTLYQKHNVDVRLQRPHPRLRTHLAHPRRQSQPQRRRHLYHLRRRRRQTRRLQPSPRLVQSPTPRRFPLLLRQHPRRPSGIQGVRPEGEFV